MSDYLRTPAWRLVGLFRSEPGALELEDGRLSFSGDEGTLFGVPVTDVRYVEFPWYNFGAGIQFDVGGRRYRFGLLRPTAEGGTLTDVTEGREAGREWKAALRAAGASFSRRA